MVTTPARIALPKFTDRLNLGKARLSVSPFCIGQVRSPDAIEEVFDASNSHYGRRGRRVRAPGLQNGQFSGMCSPHPAPFKSAIMRIAGSMPASISFSSARICTGRGMKSRGAAWKSCSRAGNRAGAGALLSADGGPGHAFGPLRRLLSRHDRRSDATRSPRQRRVAARTSVRFTARTEKAVADSLVRRPSNFVASRSP